MKPTYKHVEATISSHRDTIAKRFRVESLAVFGSVSKNTASQSSDVDILVKFKQTPSMFTFINLKKYLEDILGCSVDLVTEAALKQQLRATIMRDARSVA